MILGISLDENFAYVSTNVSNDVYSLPFSIGRNLSTKTWFIGEDTKNENVDNVDIVIDKLYYIMENDGNARIGEEEYSAKDLVKFFFSNLIAKYQDVEFITVVVRKNNVKILSKIKAALRQYFEDDDKFKVTTFSEAFVAYIKSRGEKYYGNTVALFDFTEKAITYYELVRYKANDQREYWKINTKEYLALPLDLLSGDAGKRVCDNLLLDFAKKCITDEMYSNIVLSGLGFTDTSSYREFMTFVCKMANVETSINFFSNAALILSDFLYNKTDTLDVIPMTDARTTCGIKLYAMVNGVDQKIKLVDAGEEWFDIYNKVFNVIASDTKEIKFEITRVIEGVITDKSVNITDDIKLRPDKTNILEVRILFLQQKLFEVTITDKGFGAFFEASLASTEKQIEL